jgi:flagellum-specific ATP synthase
MSRAPIEQPLDVGVRAINALLCVGRGQRMGLFAGSGVGKSVLLGMMARYTSAEVIVVGLIGERGREVKEFIEQILGEEGLRRAGRRCRPGRRQPADASAGRSLRDLDRRILSRSGSTCPADHGLADPLRHGAARDCAGHRRAAGDARLSTFGFRAAAATRRARRQRATTAGLDHRFYTVLAEGDDQQDPIADAARAILDGHIVLSRTLADAGHYPAIDIEQSISRAMVNLIKPEHLENIRHFKSLFSRYQRSRDLISVGAYAAGSDPLLDQAIAIYPGTDWDNPNGATIRLSSAGSTRPSASSSRPSVGRPPIPPPARRNGSSSGRD